MLLEKLKDLLNAGLPQTFNLLKKKKKKGGIWEAQLSGAL